MGFDDIMNFVVEKLKEFLQTIQNLGGEALQWFDQIFPPETREDTIIHWVQVALPYLIAAVVLTLLICCCRCCCCCCRRGRGGLGRMMKAPGRNCRMPRSAFEANPRSYFRNLRAYPGDQLV
nr:hypothetical protein Saspl_010887 [Ipomoea trifida]GMD13521.1 SAM and SH3 domain-containing protein [Ipomoea batatas]GMD21124.1 SAM and SH3 domain-containing protein [Ipomoea batatas]